MLASCYYVKRVLFFNDAFLKELTSYPEHVHFDPSCLLAQFLGHGLCLGTCLHCCVGNHFLMFFFLSRSLIKMRPFPSNSRPSFFNSFDLTKTCSTSFPISGSMWLKIRLLYNQCIMQYTWWYQRALAMNCIVPNKSREELKGKYKIQSLLESWQRISYLFLKSIQQATLLFQRESRQ